MANSPDSTATELFERLDVILRVMFGKSLWRTQVHCMLWDQLTRWRTLGAGFRLLTGAI